MVPTRVVKQDHTYVNMNRQYCIPVLLVCSGRRLAGSQTPNTVPVNDLRALLSLAREQYLQIHQPGPPSAAPCLPEEQQNQVNPSTTATKASGNLFFFFFCCHTCVQAGLDNSACMERPRPVFVYECKHIITSLPGHFNCLNALKVFFKHG